MNLFRPIINLYYRYIASPIKYARHIGVKIGRNCFVDTRNWSSEPYLIEICDNVQITQDVYFHTHGGCHVVRKKYPKFDVFGKIKVEDWAYVGSGSHIMPGVTIGSGSLIAAGSVVTKSVPPSELWGGVPAKFICTIDDYTNKNINNNLDSKGLNFDEKKQLLLSLNEEKFIKK